MESEIHPRQDSAVTPCCVHGHRRGRHMTYHVVFMCVGRDEKRPGTCIICVSIHVWTRALKYHPERKREAPENSFYVSAVMFHNGRQLFGFIHKVARFGKVDEQLEPPWQFLQAAGFFFFHGLPIETGSVIVYNEHKPQNCNWNPEKKTMKLNVEIKNWR